MKKNHSLRTRTAALALSLVMAGSAVPMALAANDIDGHWAQSTIEKWIAAGKISGYEDGSFRPSNPITRAEFAVILSKVLPQGAQFEAKNHVFADVEKGIWYYDALMKLVDGNIVAGGEYFRPNDPITRQEVMKMASGVFSITGFDEAALNKYTDGKQVADWAMHAVLGFVEGGYISGYEDGTLRPTAGITRAESVTILDNLGALPAADSLEGIIERVYENAKLDLPSLDKIEIEQDNVKNYLGLDTMDGIERAVASEPRMSAVAYSVCLIQAKDGVDAKALSEKIRTSVNPRKWICVEVQPENVRTAVQGQLILLAMSDDYSQTLVDTFSKLDLREKLKPDADGLVLTEDGYYAESLGALRPESIVRFGKKLAAINEKHLKNAANVYYGVIPSKAYYINDRMETPFDYQEMQRLLDENVKSAKEIDLFGALTLQDYLKTDPHWQQQRLQPIMDRLGKAMNFSVDLSKMQVNTVDGFTGQHGYNKDKFPSEPLSYLTNDAIASTDVDNYQNKEFRGVYNLAALDGKTPYDLFLSGASPLMTLTNPNASTDRELVLFRDSYGSSLAPLLTGVYRTITMVDLRYMTSTILDKHVTFDGKDVLFLYNDMVVNHSEMLR